MICASVVRRALPVRRRADPRLDEAGRVHGHLDGLPARRHVHAAGGEGRRAVAGALGKRREAETEIAAFRARTRLAGAERRHVDGLDRHVHGLDIARLVEDQARRRRIGKCLDQVAAANFDRIEAEGRRRLVHQPLDRERDHRPGDAAIRRHRTGIGDHAARDAGIFAHVVGAGHFRHRHQRLDAAGRRVARIGADIGDDVRRQREQSRIGVEGAFERDVLVAAVEAGDEILAPVLGPGRPTS